VVVIVIVIVVVVVVVVMVVAMIPVVVMIVVDVALLDHGSPASGRLVDDAAGKGHHDGRDDQAKECALHDKG